MDVRVLNVGPQIKSGAIKSLEKVEMAGADKDDLILFFLSLNKDIFPFN